jgi:hypothetical protein
MSRAKPSFWLFLKYGSKFGYVILIPLFLFDIILFNSDRIKSNPDAAIPFSCLTVMFALLILALSTSLFSERKKFQEMNELFRSGVETIGEITVVYLAARKLYITIKYVYQQEERVKTIEIPLRSRNIKNLAVGQKVTLYVNPQYPTDVVFRDLYINTF